MGLNPLRMDPTRTLGLRNRFVREMDRRLNKLKRDLTQLVETEDAFGIGPRNLPTGLSTTLHRNLTRNAGQFDFPTNPEKMDAFKQWLEQNMQDNLLQPVGGEKDKPWTADYLDSAYRTGIVRGYVDTKPELDVDSKFYAGTKAQFLLDTFNLSERTGKVKMLYQRSFEDLKGITTKMANDMSRVLADGLAAGKGPRHIARELRDAVDISRSRARTIARTEIIRAHAEGQLDSLENLGVEEVTAQVEWQTAGDDQVCTKCSSMQGQVFKIKDARGWIPLHPNCRCAWVPFVDVRKARKALARKKK